MLRTKFRRLPNQGSSHTKRPIVTKIELHLILRPRNSYAYLVSLHKFVDTNGFNKEKKFGKNKSVESSKYELFCSPD